MSTNISSPSLLSSAPLPALALYENQDSHLSSSNALLSDTNHSQAVIEGLTNQITHLQQQVEILMAERQGLAATPSTRLIGAAGSQPHYHATNSNTQPQGESNALRGSNPVSVEIPQNPSITINPYDVALLQESLLTPYTYNQCEFILKNSPNIRSLLSNLSSHQSLRTFYLGLSSIISMIFLPVTISCLKYSSVPPRQDEGTLLFSIFMLCVACRFGFAAANRRRDCDRTIEKLSNGATNILGKDMVAHRQNVINLT